MASLREIRRKIKSVKSTEQITRAMKMVAAARMRKSQAAIISSRPFAVKMEEMVRKLAAMEATLAAAENGTGVLHPFFETRAAGPAALVMVAADKGLCGAFNSNVLRAAAVWLKERQGEKIVIAAVGRKARDFVHKLQGFDLDISLELVSIFPKVNFAHAELLGKNVIESFMDKGVSSVTVLYNEFKSAAVQRLVSVQILPVPAGKDAGAGDLQDYGFEPARAELLEALLPRHVKAQLYKILLESQAAELAARMNAMDAASKNAKDLQESLNLNLNRRRQAIITGEIAELVGGAEALVS